MTVLNVDRLMEWMAFVEERHAIYEKRMLGLPQPWTTDPILASRKFTNTFRILDPGTQFIMTDLADPNLDPRGQLMRLFLYRHTGRIEVWEHLALLDGYPDGPEDLEGVRKVLHAYREPGHRRIFTNAYLVYPQSSQPGTDKIDSIIHLTSRLFNPRSRDDVVPAFLAAKTSRERFQVLSKTKGVGDFMAMQVLTDWGYLQDTDYEDDFVQLGPGAQKGALLIDDRRATLATLIDMASSLKSSPSIPVFANRSPSLMDIQNTACEFSKYVRWQEKPVAPPYAPAHSGDQPEPVLPSWWA
jgi:hypothetical protein